MSVWNFVKPVCDACSSCYDEMIYGVFYVHALVRCMDLYL